jgi:hypothetical protein
MFTEQTSFFGRRPLRRLKGVNHRLLSPPPSMRSLSSSQKDECAGKPLGDPSRCDETSNDDWGGDKFGFAECRELLVSSRLARELYTMSSIIPHWGFKTEGNRQNVRATALLPHCPRELCLPRGQTRLLVRLPELVSQRHQDVAITPGERKAPCSELREVTLSLL